MFHTQPTCPACGFVGPKLMYLPHGSWSFSVLIQDQVSRALREVIVDGTAAAARCDGDAAAWAALVASVAEPPLTRTERVVHVSEYMAAAIESTPTQAALLCACGQPLYWQWTGIS